MNQSDAKKQTIIEWQNWKNIKNITEPSYTDKSDFYYDHLQKIKPQLLTFRVGHGQDRWQVVHAWINEYEDKKYK